MFAVDLVRALYLFAPLIVASMLSAAVLRFDIAPSLARPIDGGATLGGRRVLGDGKTWRGVVTAVVGSSLGVLIQRSLVGTAIDAISVVDYRATNPFTLGPLMGLGATFGELPNSFAKRRLGIARGETARGPLAFVFWFADQVDTLVLTWPLIAAFVRPTASLVIASFCVALVVHPLIAAIGFLVGARRTAR